MGTFTKYSNGPVFGNKETGTVFDGYVWKDNGKYRMDFSWRPKKACAVTFSDDGINWSDPIITLEYDESTGWEDTLNRNCVIKVDGKYKMWYTGQAREHSYIGYAESDDGLTFKRILNEPVMISEYPWEGESVMNPCVMFEHGKYRMWYSAGETYEPNVLAYATSEDGIHWTKKKFNPIKPTDLICTRSAVPLTKQIAACPYLHILAGNNLVTVNRFHRTVPQKSHT